jgi:hypothetical protein
MAIPEERRGQVVAAVKEFGFRIPIVARTMTRWAELVRLLRSHDLLT